MESLNPSFEDYAAQMSGPEPPILHELNQETHEKASSPRMLSGHLQGRILSMLSHMVKPQRILDIGTYTGYSAICLAEGLQAEGTVHTIDKNEDLRGMAERYFQKAGYEKWIRCYTGNAVQIVEQLEGPFDLVFIDADKENYERYYELVFEKIPEGGFILADNVLWKGKVTVDPGEHDELTRAIHSYNQRIRDDHRVEKVILPVRDGLSIARKR